MLRRQVASSRHWPEIRSGLCERLRSHTHNDRRIVAGHLVDLVTGANEPWLRSKAFWFGRDRRLFSRADLITIIGYDCSARAMNWWGDRQDVIIKAVAARHFLLRQFANISPRECRVILASPLWRQPWGPGARSF